MKRPPTRLNSRSQSLEEKNEKLESIIQKLIERSKEGAIILVEGVKDVRSLRQLEVTGKIIAIKNIQIPLYDYLHKYVDTKDEIIVLTDFDRRGTQLAGKMTNYFERSGKPINLTFWLKMNGFISRDIKDIEGLASYVQTIQRKCGKHPPLLY